MNDIYHRSIRRCAAEIVRSHERLLAHDNFLDTRESFGYFFLLADTYPVLKDPAIEKILLATYDHYTQRIPASGIQKYSAIHGLFAFANFYCKLRDVGLTPDHKIVDDIINKFRHSLSSGSVNRIGLVDGISGAAVVLSKWHRWHPSNDILNLIEQVVYKLFDYLEFDRFGLSICRKYHPDRGDFPQPLHNLIDLSDGSAGVRLALAHAQSLLAGSGIDLLVASELLKNREETLFLSAGYPRFQIKVHDEQTHTDIRREWERGNVTSMTDRFDPRDLFEGTLGILVSNYYTNSLDRSTLTTRILNAGIKDMTIRHGWGATWLTIDDLVNEKIVTPDGIDELSAQFDTSLPYDVNESVGVMLLILRSLNAGAGNLFPSIEDSSTPQSFRPSSDNEGYYKKVLTALCPCSVERLAAKGFSFYDLAGDLRQKSVEQILDMLKERSVADEFLADSLRLDEEIHNIRKSKASKADIYFNSLFTFNDRLAFINLDRDILLNQTVRLHKYSTVFRSDILWVNEREDIEFLHFASKIIQTNELNQNGETVILVNESLPGYTNLKVLVQFDLILSLLDNEEFTRISDLIASFSEYFELEDDPEVRAFFITACIKVLSDAVLEDIVETPYYIPNSKKDHVTTKQLERNLG